MLCTYPNNGFYIEQMTFMDLLDCWGRTIRTDSQKFGTTKQFVTYIQHVA